VLPPSFSESATGLAALLETFSPSSEDMFVFGRVEVLVLVEAQMKKHVLPSDEDLGLKNMWGRRRKKREGY
jgi:hypothetical protein